MQPNACAMKKIIIKEDAANSPKPVEDTEMNQSEQSESEEYRRKNMLPQELAEIVWPAVQAGGLMGKSPKAFRQFPIFIIIYICT
jgi:hypothetical protein